MLCSIAEEERKEKIMFHKRLLREFRDNRKYVCGMVLTQWISLLANVVLMFAAASFIAALFEGKEALETQLFAGVGRLLLVLAAMLLVRGVMTSLNSRMSFAASTKVKVRLRDLTYTKLMKLGAGYRDVTPTSEAVQISTEGVEQLEIYFGKYVPQFFYSLLAPITLFVIVGFMSLKVAAVLLICVPLIPVSIVAVQKFAKKMLQKYWGTYTELGDTFLESLQALTTLKIYQADERYAEKMDEEAEKFRRITMRVLIMQLNSISIMDLVAYGGAAIGIVLGMFELQAGRIGLAECFFIIMISAEFFLPLRLLGSFFHIAMNGNAAADKIFRLLDAGEPVQGSRTQTEGDEIVLENVTFAYAEEKERIKEADYTEERSVLRGVSMRIPARKLTALVGTSGCGKSTLVSLLMKEQRTYQGEIYIGGSALSEMEEAALYRKITRISHDSYLFQGTLRENLQMGKETASEEEMYSVLRQVDLYRTVMEKGGLDMPIEEKGANLSGGQKQRLALARAILHDSDIYIFDEATSNVDVESENRIMAVVRQLAETKTVLVISHRLANVSGADVIFVLENGQVTEQGTQEELMQANGYYSELYRTQAALERYAETGEGEAEAGNSRTGQEGCMAVSEQNGNNAEGGTAETTELQDAERVRKERKQRKQRNGQPHSEQEADRTGFQVMRGLIGMVKPLLGVMCIAVIMGCIGNLLATFLTILGGYGLLHMAGIEQKITLPVILIGLFLSALLRGILRYAEQACNHYIAFKLLARIRHNVFAALRRLAPAKLEGAEKGNLISIITGDIELLEVFYAHTISPIVIAVITSIVMIFFIGAQHPLLGVFAAAAYLIVGAVIPIANGKRGEKEGQQYRNRFGKLNTTVLDNLYGLEEILQYGQSGKRLKKMQEQTDELEATNRFLKHAENRQRVVTDSVILAAGIAMAVLAGLLVNQGSLTAAQAVAAVIAMMSSFGPTAALSALSNNLHHTLASGSRVLQLLEEEPVTSDITDGAQVCEGDISCRNVSFSYGTDGQPILADFGAVFEEHKIHGILGRSGCGKSTLLKLLMRFYETDSGDIHYGKQNVNAINTDALRSHISYVTQETFLFHDTIEENIKVAKADATREEVIRAAKKASIHAFIESLPAGYETKLAELGDSVSGGERQRIGLARAFLHDSDVIFLDEPTSNIDSLNEGIILKSLKEERENKTILLVSHRKSTMGVADDVLAM